MANVFPTGERSNGRRSASRARRSEDEIPRERLRAAVEPHLARLQSVAERVLGCPDLARDAVQEALVALWRARDLPPNPRAWLVRAVLHRSLHARRTESRRRKWEQLAGAHWVETCPICDPESALAGRELRRRIDEALDALTPDQRLAVALREVECLDYAALAERLRVPVGTVRSRLNRARSALREALERP
jgi:RNA polymerase sigma-70 factor (ECF subfamily)